MYSIFIILHVLAAALGAGAAFVSDAHFFASTKDKKIDEGEFRLMSVSGKLVWLGIVLSLLTGFGILWLSDFGQLSSPKFLAKATIFGVIVINGIVLHRYHFPLFSRMCKAGSTLRKVCDPSEAKRRITAIALSGSLSMVSWLSVVILGAWHGATVSYGTVITAYLLVYVFAALIALHVVHKIFAPEQAKAAPAQAPSPLPRTIAVYLALILSAVAFFASLSGPQTHLIPQIIRGGHEITSILPELTPKAQLAQADASEVHVSWAPEVPPTADRTDQRKYSIHLEVLENVCELDPENGVTFDTWGYRVAGETDITCGAPGPVLRGRVGDMVTFTLTNLLENKHPHNIDFHSVTGPGGGAKALVVAPGETASIEYRLLYPGAFMYHCAYGDVPEHISHGMYGTYIVDPETPLPSVDHEWAVMQSEWYVQEPDATGLVQFDQEALWNEEPRYITFNGKVGALTGDNALAMKVGERARIYFVNEGLNLNSNFHPIGSHWDLLYPEAATHPSNLPIRGSQSTLVVTGGGVVAELIAQVPGNILLVDHSLSRTFYKGALAIIGVTGEENPEIYEVLQTPGEEPETQAASTDEVHVSIPNGAGKRANAANAYSPRELTVKKGTTVTWTNNDQIMHTVTSGTAPNEVRAPDGTFDSKHMRPGQSFSYTFNETGTFPYYCTPHPWATATVTVVD